MNQERQKTDAIADAVEIPEGATHIDHTGRYWNFAKGLVWINNKWQKDNSGNAFIWYPIDQLKPL